MTLRKSAIACVLAAMCVLCRPVPAHAIAWDHWWDYVDQLSGPGPFHGGPTIATTVVCWQKDNNSRLSPMWTKAVADPWKVPCLYFDWRRLDAKSASPFGHTEANLIDVGISFQMSKFLEIGAGIGMAHFRTHYEGVEKPFTVRSPTLTPWRLVVKPLKFVRQSWRDDPRAGAVQLIFRDTVRFGRLTAADFGAPSSPWESGTEYLRGRISIVIDVLQAMRPPVSVGPAAP